MPGLVGFIGTQRSPEDAALLHRMLASIKHQAFYETGEFAEFLTSICEGPPTFRNLDVLREEDL